MSNDYTVADALCDYFDSENSYRREVCMIYANKEVISMTSINNPGLVEFDWWAVFNKLLDGDELVIDTFTYGYPSMIHTHPPGHVNMSSVDRNMVHGWCMALGVPIRYFIMSDTSFHLYICSIEDKKLSVNDYGVVDYDKAGLVDQTFAYVMYGLSCRPENLVPEDFDEIQRAIGCGSVVSGSPFL